MAWFIGQSILIIAAAFLLGILVGWLIWGRMGRPKRETLSEAEANPPAQAHKPTQAVAEPIAAPAAVAAAEPTAEPEAEPVAEAAAEPAPEPVSVAVAEPAGEAVAGQPVPVVAVAVLEDAEPVVPDDLERIEGIGPRMAGALHDAGIRTYLQLAETDEATLRQAIEARGLRFAPSIVTWSRQARLLADGDEEGFADLTRRLVAGRDEGRE